MTRVNDLEAYLKVQLCVTEYSTVQGFFLSSILLTFPYL